MTGRRAGVGLTALTATVLAGSPSLSAPPGRTGDLLFYVDAVTVPSGDLGSRTTLYFQIPVDDISVKTETGGLYITVEIDPGDGDPVREGRVFRDLEGVKRGGMLLFEPHLDFSLPTGDYKMRVRIEDLETDKFGELRLNGAVPDFAGQKLTVSDLLFGLCRDMSFACKHALL